MKVTKVLGVGALSFAMLAGVAAPALASTSPPHHAIQYYPKHHPSPIRHEGNFIPQACLQGLYPGGADIVTGSLQRFGAISNIIRVGSKIAGYFYYVVWFFSGKCAVVLDPGSLPPGVSEGAGGYPPSVTHPQQPKPPAVQPPVIQPNPGNGSIPWATLGGAQ